MSRLRFHVATASVSLAVLLNALVASQVALGVGEPEPPEPGLQVMYHGKLTDIDRATRSFTIETPTGPETFMLVEGGRVLEAGVEKSFDALVPGQQVAVESIKDESNRWLALSVQIVDPQEIAGEAEEALER